MDIKSQGYKVFGMATNMDWEGEKLIHRLIIRLTKNNPSMGLLINARKKIAMLQPVPSGYEAKKLAIEPKNVYLGRVRSKTANW